MQVFMGREHVICMTDEQASSMSERYPESLLAWLASPVDRVWRPETSAELRIPDGTLPSVSAVDVRTVILDALEHGLDGIHRTALRELVCGFLNLPGGDHHKRYGSDVLPANVRDALRRLHLDRIDEIVELEFMREFVEFTEIRWKHDDVLGDFRPNVGKPWKIDGVDPSAEEELEWTIMAEKSQIEWEKVKLDGELPPLPRPLTSRLVALGRKALASREQEVARYIEGVLSRMTEHVWPVDDASLTVNELREIVDRERLAICSRQEAMLTYVPLRMLATTDSSKPSQL